VKEGWLPQRSDLEDIVRCVEQRVRVVILLPSS
jgi:hypothetical protein